MRAEYINHCTLKWVSDAECKARIDDNCAFSCLAIYISSSDKLLNELFLFSVARNLQKTNNSNCLELSSLR